ncbi:MAG: hypothetical protein KGK11_13510 [Sphingomonadales bacterium]|nr:hypothetical protein [Sphingomonadales bacterium]
MWLGRADVLGVAEARESARAILSDVYRGIDPIAARKPKLEVPTFRTFLDGGYTMWAKANQKAHAQNLKRLATAFKALLDKRMDSITGLDIERWRAGEIDRGLSLETINRDIFVDQGGFQAGGRLGTDRDQSARQGQEIAHG